ncbi:MAG: SDR family NAD(P)-dependent oxidoreductase [Alphaproteobacteria bacterium]
MAEIRKTARLDGKVAAITGAGMGMGRTHALILAERGAHVVAIDIDGAKAEKTAADIKAKGGAARAVALDIADVASVAREFAATEKALGRIDILVNNAGIHNRRAIEEISEADLDRMFAVHVKGAFFATKAVVPGMKARKAGKIINISSAWGMTGNHTDSHYCGAKAALLGLTKAWAKELAPWNIHVNAIAPGMVLTEMTKLNRSAAEIKEFCDKLIPLGRMGEPEEFSYAVGFLASSESDFITGQVLSPNGGEFIVGI